jgi:hypothetical protein
MKILTPNFYKFLFGFASFVILSLIIIAVVGVLGDDSDTLEPGTNIAGECTDGTTDC